MGTIFGKTDQFSYQKFDGTNEIVVEDNSEIGKEINNLDDIEEKQMMEFYKKDIENDRHDKQIVLEELNKFMNLWGSPPTRKFTVLKEFIKQLKNQK